MAPRSITVKSSLSADKLFVRSATVTEQLGQPFQIEIDLLSPDESINFDNVLGTEMTLTLLMKNDSPRHFNGFVASFEQPGYLGRFALYRARVVPWLWFLTQTADCAIFQTKHVPDIVKAIFQKHGYTDVKDKLTKSYRIRDYCVQYRESDFNFVQRLMEEEGIYYYFEHTAFNHTLVLADAYSSHAAYPGYGSIVYRPPTEDGEPYEDCISDWHLSRTIQPGKYVVTAFDFTKPRAPLQTQFVQTRSTPKSNLEIYDYLGKYNEIPEGDHYARANLESLQAGYERVRGNGNARGIATGSMFKLAEYPRKDQNREYLVTSANYKLDAGEYESGTGAGEEEFSCAFEAINSQEPFRKPHTAAKTRVSGPQTAVIVGPAGEEIWTDQYGRVKVKFHWDRDPKRDESSSCWVRVSQNWAGKGFGAVSIPRIGQEVIVDFLEGDPDQPLITGRVYNQDNMPPFALPGLGVVSGLKSQTHKGSGFNELSMDDTAGKEKINIHAQYDLASTVQHDETHTVVSGNRAMTVQTGTNTETVKGNSALTIQAGARSVDVTGGDYSASATQAIRLTGKGAGGVDILGSTDGATITGSGKGVKITGNGQGATLTGNGQGVSITGNDLGVTITGNGKGVSVIGTDSFYAHGTATASVVSPVVNIGDKTINVTGTKIVLSANGGSITIDDAGVTIAGTLIRIN